MYCTYLTYNTSMKSWPSILLLCSLAFQANSEEHYWDGNKLVHVQFTDVIEEKYTVDVYWYPDEMLAPRLTGSAVIRFSLEPEYNSFSVLTNYFHLPVVLYPSSSDRKRNIKFKYSELAKSSLIDELEDGTQPFFFEDVDFDGYKELVVAEPMNAQRHGTAYKVYNLRKDGSIFIDLYDITNVEPYKSFDSFTTFDKENETITIFGSGGACTVSIDTYKKSGDTTYDQSREVEFIPIKQIIYDYLDEDRNYIGCTKYVYDVIYNKELKSYEYILKSTEKTE